MPGNIFKKSNRVNFYYCLTNDLWNRCDQPSVLMKRRNWDTVYYAYIAVGKSEGGVSRGNLTWRT